jgi:hypothetical protein
LLDLDAEIEQQQAAREHIVIPDDTGGLHAGRGEKSSFHQTAACAKADSHNYSPLMINYSIPDLTIHPPRSVRVRIGGYAHLARLLDKARAEIHGKNAGYHYDCPVDKLLFAFTGVSAEAMLAEIKSGKSDLEILTWLNANTKRQAFEVIAWSAWLEQVGPGSAEGHEWIAGVIKGNNSTRDDIRSFAELLDLDDYISYGGKA